MKKIIGRTEKIYFKDLNLKVTAKVDTGAWRSVLHADGIEVKEDVLFFWIEDRKNLFMVREFETVNVKNSFGLIQQRYSISQR